MSQFDPEIEQEIIAVIRQELGPVIQTLASRLSSAERTAQESSELLTKIVMGFSDALDGQRKTSLLDMVNGQFGSDIDGLDGVYSDIHGHSMRDDLLDQIMSNGLDDEQVPEFSQNFLKAVHGKYGKYAPDAQLSFLAVGPEGGVEGEEPSAGDLAEHMEEHLPEEAAEIQAEKAGEPSEEMEEPEEEGSAVDDAMGKLGEFFGGKRK